MAAGVMAALWFVAAVVLQAARCGGTERMMLASQGVIGIAACGSPLSPAR